jgi:hypothetical protein
VIQRHLHPGNHDLLVGHPDSPQNAPAVLRVDTN